MRVSQEFTCIYPQPNADVDALPRKEWRECAREILAAFKPGGSRYQGCCCPYGEHTLLTGEEASRLTRAGFLVENDSEEDDRCE